MRRVRLMLVAAGLLPWLACPLPAQTLPPAFSAGMGVTYRSAADVVALVNSTPGAMERVPQFNAGAEFFVSASYPLDTSWVVKVDYSYQISSLNILSSFETAQFTITQHCPALIIQYVLTNQGVFNVKAGAGLGYYFSRLAEKFFTIDDTFSAHGPALLVELEGNTAFGDRLFACLGVNAGWSLVGPLKDSAGRPFGAASTGGDATLNSFGVGARLGLTYSLH